MTDVMNCVFFVTTYLDDICCSCIMELCPIGSYFYHEVVKRAITNSLDKTTEDQNLMSELISHLVLEKNVCSLEQCMQGFALVTESIGDLLLDNPSANKIVAQFVEKAKLDCILPETFVF